MNRTMKQWTLATAALGIGGGMIAAGAMSRDGSVEKAEVGKPAPGFTLTDYEGKEHTLGSYTEQGNVVVLEWFSYGCPFVKKHYREDTQTMNNLIASYEGKPVVWLRINSANADHPWGDADRNREAIGEFKIEGPVLIDADGAVGMAYGAKSTPEMYVINAEGVLVYHGALDNDRTARGPGDKNYVRLAVDQTLAGETVEIPTTEAYGCAVKYAD